MTLGPVCGPVSPAERNSGGWDRTSDLGLMKTTPPAKNTLPGQEIGREADSSCTPSCTTTLRPRPTASRIEAWTTTHPGKRAAGHPDADRPYPLMVPPKAPASPLRRPTSDSSSWSVAKPVSKGSGDEIGAGMSIGECRESGPWGPKGRFSQRLASAVRQDVRLADVAPRPIEEHVDGDQGGEDCHTGISVTVNFVSGV